MTFSATVAREVLAIANNLLQNHGLILVRPVRDAAWHLTSAMASHFAKKEFDINKVHCV